MSDRLREAQAELAKMRAERHPTLFDPPEDAAIESVADNAGPVWRERALEAVKTAARRSATITVNDVWRVCQDCETYDRRAIGWAMRRAAGLGWITHTGSYRKSRNPEHHGRLIVVWRSSIAESRVLPDPAQVPPRVSRRSP
jgi:hypothetical protein